MTNIVTRFAPSPTGLLHAGNYRTAVFSYLFARQNNGKFILRIEDTDKERSKKEYEDNILDSLKWLGLNYDEFHRQSERAPEHKKYLKYLIDKGFAYVSQEEALADSGAKDRRREVIRFKNPNIKVSFKDLIRGDIEVDTTDLKDFVIAKDLDTPLFHLAVVADDFDMGVTHVVRGEDHISNTPRQILIQRALGAPEPVYAHLPLILAPDRTKLSKRKGALAITEYRERGYLPEAVLNYLALLGWNPGTEQEILTKDDLLSQFDISKAQKGGAIFNEEKLRWVNKEYLKLLPLEKLHAEISSRLPEDLRHSAENNPDTFAKIVPIILDRISTLGEVLLLADGGEVGYFFNDPVYDAEGLLWKDEKDSKLAVTRLSKVTDLLKELSDGNFNTETIKGALWEYATEVGRGSVLWPLRYALSGRDKSPDPFTLAMILGKETTLRRIAYAQNLLEKNS
ncbi:MAG: glutamate--tRNA ligase family protein [Patescibacteria group bacterium]